MRRFDSPLVNLKVASPCSADWNAMAGDDRKRFCGDCKLHVYNLSGMTKYDAENLLRLSEGRLCVRYYQRPDGTVLTQDCPVGWARVKRRISVTASAAAALMIGLFGGLLVIATFGRANKIVGKIPIPWVKSTPEPVLMGAIAEPPRTPTPSPTPSRREPNKPIRRELKQQVLRQTGI